jgi:hypothetical protein
VVCHDIEGEIDTSDGHSPKTKGPFGPGSEHTWHAAGGSQIAGLEGDQDFLARFHVGHVVTNGDDFARSLMAQNNVGRTGIVDRM